GPAGNPVANNAAANGAPPEAMPMQEDAHSSRNSLDWAGTYSGILPCADCPGIRTTIALDADGRFERTLAWLESGVAPRTESGTFSWNAAGSAVLLQDAGGSGQQF